MVIKYVYVNPIRVMGDRKAICLFIEIIVEDKFTSINGLYIFLVIDLLSIKSSCNRLIVEPIISSIHFSQYYEKLIYFTAN